MNIALAYMELFCNIRWVMPKLVQIPDFTNLSFFQFCKSLFFALGKPSLSESIINIVRFCSKKQMGWANAFPVVAPMQNTNTFGDFVHRNLPSNSVSTGGPDGNLRVDAELTVSVLIHVGLPNPTTSKLWNVFRNGSVFIYLLPKPLLHRFIGHGTTLLLLPEMSSII